MHERTQRAIARMTFVFCCALPTCLTVLMIITTWTPWWHRRCIASIESDLSWQTGLIITIEDFRRASPSTLRLYNVQLLEPETGQEVARVREVRWAKQGDEVSILLQQPELQSAELVSTWRLIHDRFLCRPDQTSASVQVAANDLTIHSRSGPMTLRDVDAWIRPGLEPDSVEASIQCLPAASGLTSVAGSTPVQISVIRRRAPEGPSTSLVLDCGKTALPCSALSEFLPDLESLGANAVFSGTMGWTIYRDGWSLDLGSASFSDIALGRWCERLPHRLTGSARVDLERCRISYRDRSVQLVDIAGSLRARDGLIGTSLIESAREHLGFAVAGNLDPVIGYDRLAIGFNLNGPLLQRFEGICGTEYGYEGLHSGVVLCAGGQSLVESTGKPMQTAVLQSLFAPDYSVMVPVSRQTSPLLQLLMAPSRPLSVGTKIPPRITTTRPLQGEPSVSQPR